ncbi:DUF2334 domain-containing protein [Clostridium hydrogeniformans]|uniref:DUF2334 domain-containing protein n=1 Tax=Clostridium hydrogeniformans TaxID=349933 RepID=UPI00068D95DF|nr:DUF2334 domain-containing protein [Clostridium hydrogeniformans]
MYIRKKGLKIVLIAFLMGYLVIGFVIIPRWNDKVLLSTGGVTTRKAAREFVNDLKRSEKEKFKSELLSNKHLSKLNLYIENKKIDFNGKVFNYNNRYYIPLDDITKYLKINMDKEDSNLTLSGEGYQCDINLEKSYWRIKGNRRELRGDWISREDKVYLSLADIVDILNLNASFDSKKEEVRCFKSKKESFILNDTQGTLTKKKTALIRIEDVTAGSIYLKDDSMEKLRAMGDLLYDEGSAYHIAWIPRYVNPEKSEDNDLTRDTSFLNSEFLYTLDYLINRGAMVGLHGYTHQYGNEESIIGSEFQEKNKLSREEEVRRVEAAIKNAIALNIPYKFFETPHYRSSARFQTVLENYFDYVYEPCIGVWNKKIHISDRNKATKYVPAPLGYVEDRNVQDMINKIKDDKSKELKSFFYHPGKEFDDIVLKREGNGYPYYEYKDTSMLKTMIKELNKDGYKLRYITN